jgi:RNA polymerase sigma factor (sigma-70 family)
MTALAEDVRRAKGGDRAAFARVVERFQDVAVGYALGWLGDPEGAQDAAQEAFIDAYLRIGQLEDPAAFPGWFRRIVLKHCDRRTRRMVRTRVDPPEAAPWPEHEVSARQQREWLRGAIEALPEHERIVAALCYLGDEPQKEVADFLDLPLSTIKKRLFSARKRLEARRKSMDHYRPSRAPVFADGILLFLAIRAGDIGTTGTLLDAHRELLEAGEPWTAEEALAEGLPLPHQQTPLLLASACGDRAMVEFLLAKGARPEGTCGCPNGETALWNAVLHGHLDVARTLLAVGADPNAANGVGQSAVHIAAMRGRLDLLELLTEHGGDTALRAQNGMTPLDYRSPVPSQLGGPAPTSLRIETGIKAIDLFAPLAFNMLVRVHGPAGTGLMVLLAELARRFGDQGRTSTWVTSERTSFAFSELRAFTKQTGIDDCTTVVAGIDPKPLPAAARSFALFLFQEEGREAEFEAQLPRLRESHAIVLLVEPWAAVTRGEREGPKLCLPYGALICMSREFAEAGVYPAVDPVRSGSFAELEEKHGMVQREARELFRAGGERSERAKVLLAQPFVTWQHQNGKVGQVVPLAETLALFEQFLRS